MDGQLSKRENCAVVVHWRYLSPPAWFVRMWPTGEATRCRLLRRCWSVSGQPRPAIPAVLEGVRTKIVEGDRFRAFDWGKETKPAVKCAKK